MKSIKREPLLGAMICILIIMNGCAANKTTIEEVSPIKTEQVEKQEESTEIIPQEEVVDVILQSTEVVVPESSEVPTESIYNITPEDRETMARLVFLESNTESLECQKAVASVIINRLYSGYWGNTIDGVVYASGQFTPAYSIPYTTPTATNYEAVDYVLTNGATLPPYVLYFRAGYHFSHYGYMPFISIDNTFFGYMTKDVK